MNYWETTEAYNTMSLMRQLLMELVSNQKAIIERLDYIESNLEKMNKATTYIAENTK